MCEYELPCDVLQVDLSADTCAADERVDTVGDFRCIDELVLCLSTAKICIARALEVNVRHVDDQECVCTPSPCLNCMVDESLRSVDCMDFKLLTATLEEPIMIDGTAVLQVLLLITFPSGASMEDINSEILLQIRNLRDEHCDCASGRDITVLHGHMSGECQCFICWQSGDDYENDLAEFAISLRDERC